MSPEERAKQFNKDWPDTTDLYGTGEWSSGCIDLIAGYIRDAILQEREACAKILDSQDIQGSPHCAFAYDMADLIRSRPVP